MYGSVGRFREFDAQSAFGDLSDDVIERHITEASERFDSYVGERGYSVALDSYGTSLEQSIYRWVAGALMVSVRGANPQDPSNAGVLLGQKNSEDWWQAIAKGRANLKGDSPARAQTMTARVIYATGDDGESTRGW